MLSLLTPQSQQNLTCTPGKGEPHSWQNLASGAELPLLDTSTREKHQNVVDRLVKVSLTCNKRNKILRENASYNL